MTGECFNSTLVQLKVRFFVFFSSVGFWFQFHIGSIKSIDCDEIKKLHPEFQFHIGSIKSEIAEFIDLHVILVSIPHWFN